MSTGNRRVHTRLRRRLQVEFGDIGIPNKGTVVDVSIGGLFVAARKIYPLDARLHLHVFDSTHEFYGEGVVVRLKKVPPQLRQLEPEGMGIRLLAPAEVIRAAIPKLDLTVDTVELVCSSVAEVEKLIREQLSAGVLLVPVRVPAPALNTTVEFSVRLEIGQSQAVISGQGRILQLHEVSGAGLSAVLEVQNVAAFRDRLLQSSSGLAGGSIS